MTVRKNICTRGKSRAADLEWDDEDERVIARVSLHIWLRMFPHEADAD